MEFGGAGASQHGQTVAVAAVSASALFVFQFALQYWRGGSKKDSRHSQRAAADGLAQFLSMAYVGPQVTIENFCNIAGQALGGVAYYYSVPYGPGSGDKVEIHNEIGQGIQSALLGMRGSPTIKCEHKVDKMRLVACSKPFTYRDRPPPEFVDVLSAALNGTERRAKDSNLVAAVVRTHNDTKYGVFLMVGPTSMTAEMSLDVLSATQLWAAVLNGRLERVRLQADLSEHETTSKLYAIGTQMAQQSKIAQIAELCTDSMAEVMSVAKATLWFVDDEREEVWSLPKPDFPKGLVLPFGNGIVGHVANRFKSTGDFHQSIICTNDPSAMPSWAGDADPRSFKTLNILTVPVLVTGNRGEQKMVGVLQLVNKTNKTDLEDSIGFRDTDIRLAEVCHGILGHEILRLMIDLISQKAAWGRKTEGRSEARLSFLTEYYTLEDRAESRSSISTRGSKAEIKDHRASGMSADLAQLRLSTDSDGSQVDITNWSINYWTLTVDAQMQVLLQALHRWNVPSPGVEVMSRFFHAVRESYRDVPYHNFHHAVATVHYSFLLAEVSMMDQNLDDSDMFALLVGALCHDVDHRGYNTAFEVATRSELALRYNDNSPLENHHCAKTFQLAFNGDGNCNIFKDMSNDFYQPMRKTMVQAILGTDMKHHGEHVKHVSQFESASDIGDKAGFIVELMMHCADIANPFMPLEISKQWSAQLCKEFTNQVEAEKRLGIPVTPFMEGLTTPLARAKSAVGFAEFVVGPLVNPLFKLFEGWDPAKVNFQDNRQHFLDVSKEEEANKDDSGK